jgi:ubiquinone/menaquinone biosynthesis C-methylase UbiE
LTAEATLSHAAARALYDRIGRWQDTQRFYEDYATADLIAHADLHQAQSVFEFGVGTGRIAERLLRDHLPATARYLGIDISATMVALARQRLAPWWNRARVEQSDGSPRIESPEGTFDRFVSTYVLDLLSSGGRSRPDACQASAAHRGPSGFGIRVPSCTDTTSSLLAILHL